jgi:protein-disulfide isomerase
MFWGMHEWLFANQDGWSGAEDAAAKFRTQALALKVDGAKYDACLTADTTKAAIQKDVQDAENLGVSGTPAFFINDWFLSGAYPFADFQKAIDKAQQGIHPPPTPTPLPAGANFYDADPARAGFTFDSSPTLGSSTAPLVMLAFDDFKSPGGAAYAKDIEAALRDKYVKTGQVRVVYKFYAAQSPKAAVASLCAGYQQKFWEFRDALLAHQAEWQDGDTAAMTGYAKSLGLDEAKFSKCLADPATQAEIDAATDFARQVGVPDVPAFLFMDVKQGQPVASVLGARTIADFDTKIQPALNPAPAATAAPAPTATPAK